MTKKNFVIGIDIGTTKICVGIWENNHVEVIEIYFNRSMPSYVSFCENIRLFGKEAFDKARIKPENTIYGVKRFIGRSYEEIQNKLNYLTFNVTEENGKPYFKINYKNEEMLLTPDEIYVMLISKIKSIVEDYLNKTITDAVISVPANFNDSQRRATLDAGKLAGLNVLRIINEPTAAAINYVLNNNTKNQKILIADLGGGTFDVSIIDIQNGSSFKVMATGGDTHLGGEDLTNNLVGYLIGEIKREYQIDISTNRKSLLKLRNACEKAKCNLTSFKDTIINVEDLFQEEPFDFSKKITRSEFKELNVSLFDRIKEILDRVVKDSGLKTSDVDELVIVGGSTRIPIIQEIISSYFNGKPINKTVNLDEAVVNGATIQAAILSGNALDSLQDFTLSEIIPYSLSLKIKNGYKSTIIKRNSTIPTENTILDSFYVRNNNTRYKKFVSFLIYENENKYTKDNLLDKYTLSFDNYYSNKLKVYITISINENGIYMIKIATEKLKNSINLNINYESSRKALNDKDIDQIKSDMEMFKRDEIKEKERIESMNNLEKLVNNVKSILRNKKSAEECITNYIYYIINICNLKIEFVKNNQNINEEEDIKHKKELMHYLKLIWLHYNEQYIYENSLECVVNDLRKYLITGTNINTIISDYTSYLKNLCDSTIEFIRANQKVGKEEYEKYKKELELYSTPIKNEYDVNHEEKKRIKSIIHLENYANSILDFLHDDDDDDEGLNVHLLNYIEYLKHLCSSEIEFVKNNYKVSEKEYENHLIKFKQISMPFILFILKHIEKKHIKKEKMNDLKILANTINDILKNNEYTKHCILNYEKYLEKMCISIINNIKSNQRISIEDCETFKNRLEYNLYSIDNDLITNYAIQSMNELKNFAYTIKNYFKNGQLIPEIVSNHIKYLYELINCNDSIEDYNSKLKCLSLPIIFNYRKIKEMDESTEGIINSSDCIDKINNVKDPHTAISNNIKYLIYWSNSIIEYINKHQNVSIKISKHEIEWLKYYFSPFEIRQKLKLNCL
ncbi:HSP70-domain-containing protein [Piromyces finnis]|uniref:HSP70-domain-containing protein n=1 Tax=Piromyces finnis TaxID=1754191 RepID=A0A1Y1UX21_9FUNG|nr:HSP70-domain-containing protein [Piromyces finnis]|eukprot:ORX42760.1 HSP70-domain-containing protein [Piromyces finnis]